MEFRLNVAFRQALFEIGAKQILDGVFLWKGRLTDKRQNCHQVCLRPQVRMQIGLLKSDIIDGVEIECVTHD